MGQWTTLLRRLDNLITQLKHGMKGSVHEKPGEFMTAASLWILCATLTAKTNLFLIFKEKSHTTDSIKLGMFVGH